MDENPGAGRNREPGAFYKGWDFFLQGRCPLARKVLPHLDRIWRNMVGQELASNYTAVSGIGMYDVYFSAFAILALFAAASINSGQFWWLEDSGLMEKLRRIDGEFRPGMRLADLAECLERLKVCDDVVLAVEAILRECPRFEEWMGQLFVPVTGTASLQEVGSLIDRTEIQTLRDVFYVITGRKTRMDEELGRRPEDRRLRCEMLLPEVGMELEWRTVCLVDGCLVSEGDTCGHATGMILMGTGA